MLAKVLVVDDNPVNLKLACELLEMEGFLVYRATNAEEAIGAVYTEFPDLILMDLELPGTDGLSLTRIFKGDEKTKRIPIVAITAFAMKGDAQKAYAAGCDGYITKPIDTRKFTKQICDFLRGNTL